MVEVYKLNTKLFYAFYLLFFCQCCNLYRYFLNSLTFYIQILHHFLFNNFFKELEKDRSDRTKSFLGYYTLLIFPLVLDCNMSFFTSITRELPFS